MWIVALALRRPYTFVVMALVIILLMPLVILRTPVDIFPDINIPVVSVVWNFNGFAPTDMAQRIVSNSERGMTVTVNNIEHIESQSVQGVGVIKIFFQPDANIQTALAQVTAIAADHRAQLCRRAPLRRSSSPIPPPRRPSCSSASAARHCPSKCSLTWDKTSFARNWQLWLGAATPYPYGGKIRQVQVDLDIPRLAGAGTVSYRHR